MIRKGNITTFQHVKSLQGRLLGDGDGTLIAVSVLGEIDWWSVTTDLESALNELSLYYRIDLRGRESSLTAHVYKRQDTQPLNLR